MRNQRETRLRFEFERMLRIMRPGGLISFICGDLSKDDAKVLLRGSCEAAELGSIVTHGFMPPDEYQRKNPGRAPAKYLIEFSCWGIVKNPDETFARSNLHQLEVIFGLDYLTKPPIFIWLTEIWHPNIAPPILCMQGRPFPISATLDHICLMVADMIQYRNYNVQNALERDAARWAVENKHLFPLDSRNPMNGLEHVAPLVTVIDDGNLVEVVTTLVDLTEDEAAEGDLFEAVP